jgi:hypothetical protein
MADNGFNPRDYMTSIQGRDYLPVAARLLWLRTAEPGAAIETEMQYLDSESAVVHAKITLSTGAKGQGFGAAERAGSQRFGGRYIEKAETAAIGRALATLGYGTQFTGDEFDEGEHLADSPQEPRPRPKAKPQKPQGREPSPTEYDGQWRRNLRVTLEKRFGSGYAQDPEAMDWVRERYERAVDANQIAFGIIPGEVCQQMVTELAEA